MRDVSVVMSVYRDSGKLTRSIESVLDQKGVALEFIIVNDGADRATTSVLEALASRDRRIRLISRENRGLTQSLIEGCSIAGCEYIARQDAGDIYLPDKLAKQMDLLEQTPSAVMVSCGTRFVGPQGEFLYEVKQESSELRSNLASLDKNLAGPSHHCSVVFRRSAYERAGGYRPEFSVAQDLDLWLRLSEQGEAITTPEVLFEAEFGPGTLSGSFRELQIALTALMTECAIRRRMGEDESALLQQAARTRANPDDVTSQQHAGANYFVGRLLQRNRDPRCVAYFKAAMKEDPWHWKAALASIPARIMAPRWALSAPGSGEAR